MSLPASYFDEIYATSDDPWHFETRWYEKRKYALTLASLPRRRYRRGFEPGCSNGVLTAMLAERCDALLATDIAVAAVNAASKRLTDHANVEVREMAVPKQWPAGRFDLIVLSELGYYLSRRELITVIDRSAASLDPDGTLIAVHWRHPVSDYPLRGDDVHAILSHSRLRHLAHHDESDFLLDVYVPPAALSVAAEEGLVDSQEGR